ncbi:phage tail protein [Rahnella inusitata]|uniref:phage tail-collar fiber domain-containing protein n=1 Tax=Rahnella inusitata TaxID=58169 RepID=UPI0039AF2A28
MSAAVITEAFEQWKARQAASGQAVVLDEFVFANVPDLDVSAPIDRGTGLPDAAHIVYRQAVGKTGLVNENAVVYSVTLGADVGDFSFNWIGLVNQATGTLAMVVHAPVQSKVKNANGQQGNVLTRSFLMEYNGAETQTLISTPAETWQIDFTARLAGMDEALRLANVDVYGAGAFFDTGLLVAKTGNQYFVTAGVGYIGGLRAALAVNANITVTTKPMKVWADVSYHGTLTSAYQTDITFTLATELANYNQSGIAHYVFALANIDTNGVITDLRPKGSSQYLRKDKNLAEIADPAAALNVLNGVPKTRTVNKKTLSGDIELSPADVGALPAAGTAVAATKLATLRKIAGVAFDGTADISLSAGSVGALPIAGGTVTGNFSVNGITTLKGDVIFSSPAFAYKRGNQLLSSNYYQTNGYRIFGRQDDLFADIFHAEQVGSYHSLSFHVAGGGADGWYELRNNGHLVVTGSDPLLHVGDAQFMRDGNVYGAVWSGYLNNWIEGRTATAREDAKYWASQNLVSSVRLAGRTRITNGGDVNAPAGCVFVMIGDFGADDGYGAYSAVQMCVGGVWYTVGSV